jgi:nondiscriminating glutamyl-tRNA synthetase
MGITHVVQEYKAIDELPVVHYLYQKLGWKMPVWLHLARLVDEKAQPLSGGRFALSELQAAGYLPNALVNYLFLLGWSPAEGQEIFNLSAVRRHLRLDQLTEEAVQFKQAELNHINRHYLARFSDADLAQKIRPYLEEYYGRIPANEKWLTALAQLLRPEINKLEDAAELAAWALDDVFETTTAAEEALASSTVKPVFTKLIAELAHVVLLDAPTAVSILTNMSALFHDEYGWSEAQIRAPIQAALIGRVDGPPLSEVMGLLGKARCQERLGTAVRGG